MYHLGSLLPAARTVAHPCCVGDVSPKQGLITRELCASTDVLGPCAKTRRRRMCWTHSACVGHSVCEDALATCRVLVCGHGRWCLAACVTIRLRQCLDRGVPNTRPVCRPHASSLVCPAHPRAGTPRRTSPHIRGSTMSQHRVCVFRTRLSVSGHLF